jgi:hypothetical protein
LVPATGTRAGKPLPAPHARPEHVFVVRSTVGAKEGAQCALVLFQRVLSLIDEMGGEGMVEVCADEEEEFGWEREERRGSVNVVVVVADEGVEEAGFWGEVGEGGVEEGGGMEREGH